MTEIILYLRVARQMCLKHTLTQIRDYTGNFRRNSLLTAPLRDVKRKKRREKEMSKGKLEIQIYKLRVNGELRQNYLHVHFFI